MGTVYNLVFDFWPFPGLVERGPRKSRQKEKRDFREQTWSPLVRIYVEKLGVVRKFRSEVRCI